VTLPGAERLPAGVRPTRRRCRRRTVDPSSPRPSALVSMFFIPAIVLLLASAGAALAYAITGDEWLHWLALHLALLGGVSQLVLGAGQFFVCAFLATDPPSRRLVTGQLLAWNGGTLLVAVGVPTATGALIDAGAALIGLGLLLFAVALRAMQRRSLQRARWAVRWYQACAACLGAGALVGVMLARATPWPDGSLLGAHLALNVGGWLGTAIVGTLHTFFPSLTQTRLRFPVLQGPTFTLWLLGVGLLACGAAFALTFLIVAGWVGLASAAALLAANLRACLRSALRPLALPAMLIALAQAFLVAGLLFALAVTIEQRPREPLLGAERDVLAILLLAGWVGLTVFGALLHLLAVLARVRDFSRTMPVAVPARDPALAFSAALGIAALAASHASKLEALATPATVILLAALTLLGTRVLALAITAVRPRPAGAR
jgi:nitrite reductase (NO-forming)